MPNEKLLHYLSQQDYNKLQSSTELKDDDKERIMKICFKNDSAANINYGGGLMFSVFNTIKSVVQGVFDNSAGECAELKQIIKKDPSVLFEYYNQIKTRLPLIEELNTSEIIPDSEKTIKAQLMIDLLEAIYDDPWFKFMRTRWEEANDNPTSRLYKDAQKIINNNIAKINAIEEGKGFESILNYLRGNFLLKNSTPGGPDEVSDYLKLSIMPEGSSGATIQSENLDLELLKQLCINIYIDPAWSINNRIEFEEFYQKATIQTKTSIRDWLLRENNKLSPFCDTLNKLGGELNRITTYRNGELYKEIQDLSIERLIKAFALSNQASNQALESKQAILNNRLDELVARFSNYNVILQLDDSLNCDLLRKVDKHLDDILKENLDPEEKIEKTEKFLERYFLVDFFKPYKKLIEDNEKKAESSESSEGFFNPYRILSSAFKAITTGNSRTIEPEVYKLTSGALQGFFAAIRDTIVSFLYPANQPNLRFQVKDLFSSLRHKNMNFSDRFKNSALFVPYVMVAAVGFIVRYFLALLTYPVGLLERSVHLFSESRRNTIYRVLSNTNVFLGKLSEKLCEFSGYLNEKFKLQINRSQDNNNQEDFPIESLSENFRTCTLPSILGGLDDSKDKNDTQAPEHNLRERFVSIRDQIDSCLLELKDKSGFDREQNRMYDFKRDLRQVWNDLEHLDHNREDKNNIKAHYAEFFNTMLTQIIHTRLKLVFEAQEETDTILQENQKVHKSICRIIATALCLKPDNGRKKDLIDLTNKLKKDINQTCRCLDSVLKIREKAAFDDSFPGQKPSSRPSFLQYFLVNTRKGSKGPQEEAPLSQGNSKKKHGEQGSSVRGKNL